MNPSPRIHGGLWRGLALLAALGFAAAGCARKGSSDEAGGPESIVQAEVTLTRVVRADVVQTVTITGTVAALPNQDVRVSALVPGRLAEMKVAEGDHVEAGQVLVRLDDRPFHDHLQQAEAAAAQASASQDNAKLSLARNEDLFQRGIAARKDLEDARTQASVSAAALRQAEGALELARLQLARTEIRSPLTGTVVKRFAGVGEQVDGTATQPIVEVANLDSVELLGNIPARYLSRLRPGQALTITTDAVPDQTFTGRVVAISPAVDPATNIGLLRIRLPNPGGALRLGIYLSTQIPVESHAQALTVPPEAVYRDDRGAPRVFQVRQDVATAMPVTLGLESHDRVEILSGLQEGDAVILSGGYGLPDKATVRVKP